LKNITIRDEIGIYRLVAGLAKILFPNKQLNKENLEKIVNIVIEYRQMIADLLHKMAPGEFERKKITYSITGA